MTLTAQYIGYTRDTNNLGDEVLVWLIADRFKPLFRFVPANGPADLALLGGGTLINQSPWLIDFFEARLASARFALAFGTGVGDPSFWGESFDRWRPLLRQCWNVGVRGPHSLRLLNEHDIAAEMIGDPFLQIQAPFIPAPIAGRIGVNLGLTNDALLGGGHDKDYLDVAAEALAGLARAGHAFEWFSVWEKDRGAIEAIRERVAPASGPVIDARAEPLRAFSALARCELFVGEKLHACALAAVAGVPFVALEYQPKVRDFAASIDMEDACISTAERDPAALRRHIEHHLARTGPSAAAMGKAVAALRECQQSFRDRFFHHVEAESQSCAS